MSQEEKDVIQNEAMKTIEDYSCVRYEEYKGDEKAFLHFVKTGNKTGGCTATMEKKDGEQRITLADSCFQKNSLLHEMMHSLGFYHEQQRYDRDEFITVHLDNIKDSHLHNYNKISEEKMDTLGTPYDYCSLMQYAWDGSPSWKKVPLYHFELDYFTFLFLGSKSTCNDAQKRI